MESNKQVKKTIPPEYGRSFKLGRVILSPESPILEFKDFKWPFPKEEVKNGKPSKKIVLLKTICGFLNNQGGTILIGVQDNKKISGVYLKENEIDLVKQYVNNLQNSIFPKDRFNIVTEQLPIKNDIQQLKKCDSEQPEKWIKNLYVIRIQVPQGKLNRLYTFKIQNNLFTSIRSDARSDLIHDINDIQQKIYDMVIYPKQEVKKQEYLAPDPEGLSVSESLLVSSQVYADRDSGDPKNKGKINLRDYKNNPSLVPLSLDKNKKFHLKKKKRTILPKKKNLDGDQPPSKDNPPNKDNPPLKENPIKQLQEDQPRNTNDEKTLIPQKGNPTTKILQVASLDNQIPQQNPFRQSQQTGKQVQVQVPQQVEVQNPSEKNNQVQVSVPQQVSVPKQVEVQKPSEKINEVQVFVPQQVEVQKPSEKINEVQVFVPQQVEVQKPSEKSNKQEQKEQKKIESPLFIVRSQEKIDIVSKKINQKFNGDIEKKPKLKMVLKEVALAIGKTEKEIEFFQLLEQKDVVTSGPSSLLINLTDEEDINWAYDLIELFDCEATIFPNNNFGSGSQMNEEIIGFIKVEQIKILDSLVSMIQFLETNDFTYQLPDRF